MYDIARSTSSGYVRNASLMISLISLDTDMPLLTRKMKNSEELVLFQETYFSSPVLQFPSMKVPIEPRYSVFSTLNIDSSFKHTFVRCMVRIAHLGRLFVYRTNFDKAHEI